MNKHLSRRSSRDLVVGVRVPERPRPLLVAVGGLLIVVSIVGFLLKDNPGLVGAFLFLGFLLVVIAVFEPRMEGPQVFGLTSAKITLKVIKREIVQAEAELASGEAVVVRGEDLLP
jgi:hypothetical protein